jgi:hypothetical protein
MNEITKKWLITGLIDEHYEKIDQAILSNNLEEAVQELLKSTDEPEDIRERKACLFLPIIVRLFYDKKLRIINDMTDLYKTFSKFYNINWPIIKDLERIHAVDGEAEFCCMFVKHFEEL